MAMQAANDNNTSNGVSNHRPEFTSHLLLSDNEILELGIRSCDVELYRRKHYQAKFGIDTWYDSLSEHTFRTSNVPLQYETGNAITQKYYSKPLTEQQEIFLKDLETTIDAVAQKEFPNGFFIKLNTRSPKDVPVYAFENPKVQQLVIQEIEKLDTRDRNENNEVIAFIKATNKAMKLHTGKEAVELLTASTRICEDLNKVLQFPPHLFDCKLILREWLDEVAEHPEGEFRCFVHKNSLNAITQYFCFSYFDDLAKNKDHVQNQIITFFDSVKDKLQSHCSYVVDFFVLPDRVIIIELNPFHSGAGSGLFSWKDHRELFMNGPLEMRVVEKPTNSKEVIPAYWQRFIDSRYHPNKLSEDDEEVEEERQIPKFWPWTVVAVMLVGVFVYKKYLTK